MSVYKEMYYDLAAEVADITEELAELNKKLMEVNTRLDEISKKIPEINERLITKQQHNEETYCAAGDKKSKKKNK